MLRGVLFRSGSPTEQGLQRLCRDDFKRVYSLYGARTTAHGPPNEAMARTGADARSCVDADGRQRSLPWVAAVANRGKGLPRLLRDVLESVRDPDRGPILIHCWNGLHYAGMIAALVLRQLCGASAETAEAYWWSTTSHGENYPHVIRTIRAFRPLPGFALSEPERERLCPALPAAQARR